MNAEVGNSGASSCLQRKSRRRGKKMIREKQFFANSAGRRSLIWVRQLTCIEFHCPNVLQKVEKINSPTHPSEFRFCALDHVVHLCVCSDPKELVQFEQKPQRFFNRKLPAFNICSTLINRSRSQE